MVEDLLEENEKLKKELDEEKKKGAQKSNSLSNEAEQRISQLADQNQKLKQELDEEKKKQREATGKAIIKI